MKFAGKAVLYPGTPDEVWGFCQTQDVTPNAAMTEIQRGDGETAGVMFTKIGEKKFTGTYTPIPTEADHPVDKDDLIGEIMPFHVKAGVMNLVITGAPFKRKVGDKSEITIEGTYYPLICGSEGSGGTSSNPTT